MSSSVTFRKERAIDDYNLIKTKADQCFIDWRQTFDVLVCMLLNKCLGIR